MDTDLVEDTIKDELSGDSTRYSDRLGHCRVATRLTIELKGRRERVLQ